MRQAFDLARQAKRQGATFVALPEYCAGLASHNGAFTPFSAPEASHPVLAAMQEFARVEELFVLVGSIGVLGKDGRVFNRSFLVDRLGRVVGRYDKIHLFDIELVPGAKTFRESATIAAGQTAVMAPVPGGRMGMSVCYDLRFPMLYRGYAQAGASLMAVPAAFMHTTGEAHWHALLRARAIETGSFVIAPGQCGSNNGTRFYGHSLIVDPWGAVLADAGVEPGIAIAEIDLAEAAKARARIPAWNIPLRFGAPEFIQEID